MYYLMGNHYHLLVETPEPNLSAGMRYLNGVYTQRYNGVHRTAGHVFQGRFKAVLVEKEAHLIEVSRYAATAGLRMGVPWLSTDWLLTQFGVQRHAARKAYRQFVREGRDVPPLEGLAGGFILGREVFVARCRAMLEGDEALAGVPRTQQHVGRPSLRYREPTAETERGSSAKYKIQDPTLSPARFRCR